MRHLAAAFEDHAFVNAETGGKNIATKDGGPVDFHAVLGSDGSGDFTANDYGARVNGSVDARALSNNQSVRRVDFAAKHSADSDRPLKAQLSFEFTAVLDHTRNRRMGGGNVKICALGAHIFEF